MEQAAVPYRGENNPVSVAPMMKRTDRHFRYLMRQISKRTLLYTEMVTTGAILHGDRDRHLRYSEIEHPLALQLGGDDPVALRECALIAENLGYDEVNINVGCPSDRVQKGRFGACLMAEPERVADAVAEMRAAVSIPVTVKHRIGIDDLDRYEDMLRFVDVVSQSGADRFSVHARKAWLQGLSPKENRTIPPLRYADVYRLKTERPNLRIEINGGVTDVSEMRDHLDHVDAVMIGRAAYENPMFFSEVDHIFYGQNPDVEPTVFEVVEAMRPYIADWIGNGGRLNSVTRHMLMLFYGRPGGRRWRRILGEAIKPGTDMTLLDDALAAVRSNAGHS
ncbi:MAG: tRNA dihydrouridine(20/20a) synthase DusA [Myxococcota bacterium]|nr:tRNA dihydrouridine(20/20a) synthase DusA [Myxococcota bacterium]